MGRALSILIIVFRSQAPRALLITMAMLASQRAPGQIGNDAAERDQPSAPVSIWLGRLQSDNIRRVAEGGRGAYNSLGTDFGLAREFNRFEGGLTGNLEFRSYDSDTGTSDERVGDLNAFANFDIVPDRFSWLIQDSYSTARTDFLRVDNFDNRENISVFSTGPELNLPLGERNSLEIKSIYSDANYADSNELDSKSVLSEFSILHQANSTLTYGISGTVNDIEYVSDNFNYKIKTLALVYEKTLSSGEARIELGRNAVTQGTLETDGPLARLSWSRDVGRRGRLGVSGNREFTNSSIFYGARFDISNRSAFLPGMTPDIALTRSVVERKDVAMNYEWEFRRTDIVISTSATREIYQDLSDLNNENSIQSAYLRRELTTKSSIDLSVTIAERDFSSIARKERDRFFSASYTRSLSGSLDLDVNVEKAKREGADAFSELLYEVRVIYAFFD